MYDGHLVSSASFVQHSSLDDFLNELTVFHADDLLQRCHPHHHPNVGSFGHWYPNSRFGSKGLQRSQAHKVCQNSIGQGRHYRVLFARFGSPS